MSKRRELQTRIDSLAEIREIMTSMKNLAIMETRKLSRYQQNQQRVVDSMVQVLNQLRYHYSVELSSQDAQPAYLLFGAERGFCGGYNEQLIEAVMQQPNYQQAPLLGVGSRLAEPLQRQFPNASCIPGASVADEVATVLPQVFAAMNQLRQVHGELHFQVLHFQPDTLNVQCQPLLPPKAKIPTNKISPLITLPPHQLLVQLLEHYLFALSHAWFYSALMAENQQRVQHLEQADRHMEKQLDEMGKRRNVLRQEEIVEEIEVILLSAEAVSTPGGI